MSDWVVALLPRASAERVIAAQKMTRAPIAMTEQYYRFVDPESGPMIGGFAPTGDAMAKVFVDAFGGDPAAKIAKGRRRRIRKCCWSGATTPWRLRRISWPRHMAPRIRCARRARIFGGWSKRVRLARHGNYLAEGARPGVE
ncbi:hypothetical protein QP150_06110 [Sphingomonas sp. 22L2VL55-3]